MSIKIYYREKLGKAKPWSKMNSYNSHKKFTTACFRNMKA